jgi:cytochrome P450
MRSSATPALARSILHMDPPEHAVFRKLVNRQFTPRALSGLEESIRKSACRLLDAVDATAETDFVAELAAPFPLGVIAELLGIDEADREAFRRWSDAAIESPDLPPEETTAALGELSGFIIEHIGTKRARPGQDLVSLLVGSEVDGQPLSREELFMFLLTLLVAGNETTRTLLSGSAIVLAEHPEQRASLAGDPALLPGAVEECLRWVTPVHAFCRTATEDAVISGTEVRAGDYLCMLYASANRDERVFGPDAAEFDVRRQTVPVHLAFGFGEHVCLGASLARIETRIFYEELLARFPRYEVAAAPERVRSTTVAGIRSLAVVLGP